ncbi:amidohydrolase family protein [Thermoactinomyces sp. CICC 10523]|uniref:amidohydrolase family protein n=1 Tax=Thermoactinomyces sp. CICC 10523 TaxID=2767428 RepID=UPI0018DD2E5C|nr:amidohydrolase family protein [Thermoactinomyces sp. CICC 10523]MBH8598719.1 amidohydrolase family protein [Thermoactinomyces sp. CICC 10523]
MIIDSHSHVMLPVEKQIELMNEAGIDKTILFYTSIHPERATDFQSYEKEMRKLFKILGGHVNDAKRREKGIEEQLQSIRLYPDRFLGFGSVPNGLNDEKTAEWVEKQVIGNGFKGLGEFTLAPGQINTLEPVFKSSCEFGYLPIWVHTLHPLGLSDIKELAELAKKYAKVPVIFGHLGGLNWLDTIKITKEISNAYLDVSAFYTTVALSLAMLELPERTLFSSDSPYGDPLLVRMAVERHSNDPYTRKCVLGDNIAKLLNL